MPILFYDLETFGRSPARDRIAEFAGILTDDELNLIEQPSEVRCVPPPDYLAHPAACLVNGITPVAAAQTGLPEPEFARRVRSLLMREPNTLIVGYNNAAFDDEFLRHLFYRTFLDPYDWHYRNGNARLDMLAVVPALFDFQREALSWPRDESGRPDFRLEALAEANTALGGTSHEALADTFALRNLCKMLADRIPEVWQRLPAMVSRRAIEARLRAAAIVGDPSDPERRQQPSADAPNSNSHRISIDGAVTRPAHWRPTGDDSPGAEPHAIEQAHDLPGLNARGPARYPVVVYASPRLKTAERSSSLFVVLGREEGGAGKWWLADLSHDPRQLLNESPETPAGAPPRQYPSLQRINPRRFPVVFAPEPHHESALADAGLAISQAYAHAGSWHSREGRRWTQRFLAARSRPTLQQPQRDLDEQLYDGFVPDRDRTAIADLAGLGSREIAKRVRAAPFEDERLRGLAARFPGRYVPTLLSAGEREAFRRDAAQRIDVDQFDREWRNLLSELQSRRDGRTPAERRSIMRELAEHRNVRVQNLGLADRYGELSPNEYLQSC